MQCGRLSQVCLQGMNSLRLTASVRSKHGEVAKIRRGHLRFVCLPVCCRDVAWARSLATVFYLLKPTSTPPPPPPNNCLFSCPKSTTVQKALVRGCWKSGWVISYIFQTLYLTSSSGCSGAVAQFETKRPLTCSGYWSHPRSSCVKGSYLSYLKHSSSKTRKVNPTLPTQATFSRVSSLSNPFMGPGGWESS